MNKNIHDPQSKKPPLKSDNRLILSENEITDLKNEIVKTVHIVLKALRFQAREKKDIMLMYSLARAIVQIESVFALFKMNHDSDCLILYRTQVERLLTLYHIIDTNTVSEFDDWSFIVNFEERNGAASDIEHRNFLNKSFWEESEKRKIKYQRLKESGVKWKRPSASEFEVIAKKHRALDLYKYGYKYASGFVHPLSNDGELEFGLVLGIKPNGKPDLDRRPIISNALVVLILIFELSLNEFSFKFNDLFFQFKDSCKESIRNGSKDYIEIKNKINDLGSQRTPRA